jgi:hypothetical protein
LLSSWMDLVRCSGIPLPGIIPLYRLGPSSPLVKRITIAIPEELYATLLEFTADECKKKQRKLSLGNSIRTLMSSRLEQLGYRNQV